MAIWILKEELASKQRGRDVYFHRWTAIGPAATEQISEAALFASEEDAKLSPAWSHHLSFYEPVPLAPLYLDGEELDCAALEALREELGPEEAGAIARQLEAGPDAYACLGGGAAPLAVIARRPYRLVEIADLIGPFPALLEGTLWNGWECPAFTREAGLEICEAYLKSYGTERAAARYEEEEDRFVFNLDEDEPEYFPVCANGLYAIGAWCWTWQRYPAPLFLEERPELNAPDPDPPGSIPCRLHPGLGKDSRACGRYLSPRRARSRAAPSGPPRTGGRSRSMSVIRTCGHVTPMPLSHCAECDQARRMEGVFQRQFDGLVADALDSAEDHGYDLTLADEDLAQELAHHITLERFYPEEIIPAIRAWRVAQALDEAATLGYRLDSETPRELAHGLAARFGCEAEDIVPDIIAWREKRRATEPSDPTIEDREDLLVRALDRQVLVVATRRLDGWRAYIGAVAGKRHADEWRVVLDHGAKLHEAIARAIVPEWDRFPYVP